MYGGVKMQCFECEYFWEGYCKKYRKRKSLINFCNEEDGEKTVMPEASGSFSESKRGSIPYPTEQGGQPTDSKPSKIIWRGGHNPYEPQREED